jgi:hypothetical protein
MRRRRGKVITPAPSAWEGSYAYLWGVGSLPLLSRCKIHPLSRRDIHDIRCLPNTKRKFSEYFMTTYSCFYSHGLKMVPNFESGSNYMDCYGHCFSQGIWVFSGIMLILYCSIQITQWDQISLSLQVLHINLYICGFKSCRVNNP